LRIEDRLLVITHCAAGGASEHIGGGSLV
jgi:hypothetical protein